MDPNSQVLHLGRASAQRAHLVDGFDETSLFDAVHEVIKYPTKPADLTAAQMLEVIGGWKGVRLQQRLGMANAGSKVGALAKEFASVLQAFSPKVSDAFCVGCGVMARYHPSCPECGAPRFLPEVPVGEWLREALGGICSALSAPIEDASVRATVALAKARVARELGEARLTLVSGRDLPGSEWSNISGQDDYEERSQLDDDTGYGEDEQHRASWSPDSRGRWSLIFRGVRFEILTVSDARRVENAGRETLRVRYWSCLSRWLGPTLKVGITRLVDELEGRVPPGPAKPRRP